MSPIDFEPIAPIPLTVIRGFGASAGAAEEAVLRRSFLVAEVRFDFTGEAFVDIFLVAFRLGEEEAEAGCITRSERERKKERKRENERTQELMKS